MANTTLVSELLSRVKVTLLELGAEGVRWTNDELVQWLNEAYTAIVGIRPDANSVTVNHALDPGTRQSLPDGGLRLHTVTRNTAAGSDKSALRRALMESLNTMRPSWHTDTPTQDIEVYLYNPDEPTAFYVYPPADAGAEVELIYSAVPTLHDADYDASKNNTLRLDSTYEAALVDYILYRAYSKDADAPQSLNRAGLHFKAFSALLGSNANAAHDELAARQAGA